MILTPVTELTEGMVSAQEIRSSNNLLMLASGVTLDASLIRWLQSTGHEALYVEPQVQEVLPAEDAIPRALRRSCEDALRAAFRGFQASVETRHLAFDAEAIMGAASDLVGYLLSAEPTACTLLDVHDWSGRLFQHSVNTAVLGTLIAREMGYSEEACHNLALGMMFHDCGQLFLPREVFDKTTELTAYDWLIVRRHPRAGYENLKRKEALPEEAAQIVLRHHERVDGRGYPDGLQGDAVPPLARIASVVEAFDSMTSLRAYGRAMTPDQAMQTIRTQAGRAYDLRVVDALVKHVALYPLGAAVRLSTGEYGLVARINPEDTTRPLVRLYYGPDGRRMAPCELDLTQHRARNIVESAPSLDTLREAA